MNQLPNQLFVVEVTLRMSPQIGAEAVFCLKHDLTSHSVVSLKCITIVPFAGVVLAFNSMLFSSSSFFGSDIQSVYISTSLHLKGIKTRCPTIS